MFFLSGSSEQKPIHFSNPTSQDPVQICKPFCVCVFRAYCIYVEKKKKDFPHWGVNKVNLVLHCKVCQAIVVVHGGNNLLHHQNIKKIHQPVTPVKQWSQRVRHHLKSSRHYMWQEKQEVEWHYEHNTNPYKVPQQTIKEDRFRAMMKTLHLRYVLPVWKYLHVTNIIPITLKSAGPLFYNNEPLVKLHNGALPQHNGALDQWLLGFALNCTRFARDTWSLGTGRGKAGGSNSEHNTIRQSSWMPGEHSNGFGHRFHLAMGKYEYLLLVEDVLVLVKILHYK